jgi:hypothetical protein
MRNLYSMQVIDEAGLAVEADNVDALRPLLEGGLDPQEFWRGWPLLFHAAQGRVGCLKALLVRAAEARAVGVDARGIGRACLANDACLVAALSGQVECLRALAEDGRDVDVRNDRGQSPLHLAAERGHVDCVRLLLALGMEVDCLDSDDWTPAMAAATCLGGGSVAALDCLLEAGADLERFDEHGSNALHHACSKGALEAVEWLARHGARLSETDEHGMTGLRLAARYGRLACVKLLLSEPWRGGVDVGSELARAARDVAEVGEAECLKALMQAGANLEGGAPEGPGCRALALGGGHHDCVALLDAWELSASVAASAGKAKPRRM